MSGEMWPDQAIENRAKQLAHANGDPNWWNYKDAVVREALKAADWKDGLAEAYRVLLDARRSLLEEKERNSHLRGVYEPVICALEPALAEVGELYRERQASLSAPQQPVKLDAVR